MRKTLLLTASASCLLTACMTRPLPVVEPIRYIAEERPSRIWMSTGSNPTPLIVNGPTLLGDTLFGRQDDGAVVWVPVVDVQRVEAQRPDRLRTALLVAGIGGTALGVALMIRGNNQDAPPVPCPNTCYPAVTPAAAPGSVSLSPFLLLRLLGR